MSVEKSWLRISLIFTIFLGLLLSRRSSQLISPQVWQEDGTQVLDAFIRHGLVSFFEPVNGYLISISKIISAISLGISFSSYPIISSLLSWIFTGLICLVIVTSKTKLDIKFACALGVIVVPSDPEVFGLPLYAFWWSSLLLFLLAIWDENDTSVRWRLGFLLIGGLSSPVIILILPVLYFRTYWYRESRSEKLIAIVSTFVAFIQFFFIIKGSAGHFPKLGSVLKNIIPTFFGRFLIGNWTNNGVLLWFVGLILLGTIIGWFLRERNKGSSWILIYILFGVIALSASRVDPSIIHPKYAGPRYFFFPFTLMFWILIQGFSGSNPKWLRFFFGFLVITSVINAVPVWSRDHDDLHWKNHIRSCRFFSKYAIPIHTNGNESSTWKLILDGTRCAELLNEDLLLFKKNEINIPTFAYTVLKTNKLAQEQKAPKIIKNTMIGADFQKSNLEGYRIIGSFDTSDADTGEVLLRLHRGDRILYRSGPVVTKQSVSILGNEEIFINRLPVSTDWVTLEFSNENLPNEFSLKISDDGTEWGEWSAIAIGN